MNRNANRNGREDGAGPKPRREGAAAFGFPIGAGFGVAIGLVIDNLALGIAFGALAGVAIGFAMDRFTGGGTAVRPARGGPLLWLAIGIGALLLVTAAFWFGLIRS